MKNMLSHVLHGYAGSNEGANFVIYETLEIAIKCVQGERACVLV